MGIIKARVKFMDGFTVTFLHDCFGCSNCFADNSKAEQVNRTKTHLNFTSPSHYPPYYVDSSKPSKVCKFIDSTKRKKLRNSLQIVKANDHLTAAYSALNTKAGKAEFECDSSDFSGNEDFNRKISPVINIPKHESVRKIKVSIEDGGLASSETDHEKDAVLKKKIKKRSQRTHFKKSSCCKIFASNNGKLVKKCKQVESICKPHPSKNKQAESISKPHPQKNKQVENIHKPYSEKNEQVESLHKPQLKRSKQAKSICKTNLRKGRKTENVSKSYLEKDKQTETRCKQGRKTENISKSYLEKDKQTETRCKQGRKTENISKSYLEKDKQTETRCKQNLPSNYESSDIVIPSKSEINLKRKKKDSLLKCTKEPSVGTLKRRRWNQAKYKKNNENHEDDLFEARKFDLAELSELAEDSYTDSSAMILTPDFPEICLNDDEESIPLYEECCSAEEFNMLRTKAQEYHFRRNKRKIKRLNKNEGKGENKKKDLENTVIAVNDFLAALKSEDEAYISDESVFSGEECDQDS